jgi:hypothetical protein
MPSLSDRAAVKAMFRGDGDLARRVHVFNRHPAAYAHPSWFEDLMEPQWLDALRSSPRAEKRLSEILLARHGLAEDLWYDFGSRRWRFALLPADALLKLVDCCGLAFQHRRIAASISHSERTYLKNQIGERAYLFALKRAPLLLGRHPGTKVCWEGQSDFGRLVRRSGAAYFLSHFLDAPTAIAGRLSFKFARDLVIGTKHPAPQSDGWPLFKRILRHELEPKWQILFS